MSQDETALRGVRVLVVEDDALIAFYIEEILRGSGADVVGVHASADAALAALDGANGPDAAIVDLHPRDGRADGLVEALRGRAIPAVIVTGMPPSELPRHLRQHPVIPKPFAPSDLVARLAAAERRPAQGDVAPG